MSVKPAHILIDPMNFLTHYLMHTKYLSYLASACAVFQLQYIVIAEICSGLRYPFLHSHKLPFHSPTT